jgi:HK97 gp10 family phage protein
MADNFTVKIEGLAEIKRKLDKLPERIGRNAMRRSLRKGANVIRDAARNNAKRIDDEETREQIWKNISVQSGGRKRERQVGGVMMRVGVLGGARFKESAGDLPGGNTTGYWRLVHFGTSQVAARPFLSSAASESAEKALQAIVSDMPKQIDKELSKLR